jgi:hypothetical protein
MSEAPDPLEAELSALRPHELSRGLRRRIGQRLAEASPPKPRRLWWLALAGGLAAAFLAAILIWWGGGRRVEPKPIVIRHRPAPPALVEDSEPTLLAYQRALARSPEELDALLNKHALGAPQPNPELLAIGAFTRSDPALHALLGED